MLSLHTNAASLSAQSSLSKTQNSLSNSMTRLSTGYRINSSMDDAAGLQIATRLKAQSSGMAVAMRNTQNSISMMQTADGALDEVNNILTRMKDLATQAADGSSSDDDKTAMDAEYNSLTDELSNIFSNTSFGGTKLLSSDGKLAGEDGITFQIGSDKSETMTAKFNTELGDDGVIGKIKAAVDDKLATDGTGDASENTVLSTDANGAIDNLNEAIKSVSTLRSKLGAVSNRLDHVYNNLSNMSSNTQAATGRIMDVDFATESASMTSNQMLMQAGTAMLKQTNSMSSMVMSLLQ
ncbi:flagellin [uncultured Massilia sp.]|uniref:flagellin N-terminal helical domain-containing protein n=1 Tax=uncultured Massilia sp. TaxID=169973 RepID=UPI0025FFC28E|nr:flagellin [uncultured Massilia sp.]